MTKHRGRGIASINYPIGMNLGGDPSQALVHSNPSGKFTVSLSSIDLGQGMKSVTRQICAETLGVPVEDVYVDTADSDTGPHCMGSFASRGTHRVGNAVMAAAKEARGVMMEAAAEELRSMPPTLKPTVAATFTSRAHRIDRSRPRMSPSPPSSSRARRFPAAASSWCRSPPSIPRPAKCPPRPAMRMPAWSPRSRSMTRPGRWPWYGWTAPTNSGARSIRGWSSSSLSAAPGWESATRCLKPRSPIIPIPSQGPRDFVEYLMPGPGDICPHDIAVLERPAADGPFGAKGPGEMCANPVMPAVANAIFNAVGVRVDESADHAGKSAAAIKGQGGARPQARR